VNIFISQFYIYGFSVTHKLYNCVMKHKVGSTKYQKERVLLTDDSKPIMAAKISEIAIGPNRKPSRKITAKYLPPVSGFEKRWEKAYVRLIRAAP